MQLTPNLAESHQLQLLPMGSTEYSCMVVAGISECIEWGRSRYSTRNMLSRGQKNSAECSRE